MWRRLSSIFVQLKVSNAYINLPKGHVLAWDIQQKKLQL